MKSALQSFVGTFAENANQRWKGVTLSIAAERGAASPVDIFYTKAIEFCRTPPAAPPAGPSVPDALPPEQVRARVDEYHSRLLGVLSATLPSAADKDAEIRDKATKLAAEPEFTGIPEISEFVTSIQLFPAEETLRSLARARSVAGPALLVGTDIARTLRQRQTAPDFAQLGTILEAEAAKNPTDPIIAQRPRGWCSLIYNYWLDEGGLPWGLERLADRIENGVVRTTQALQAVRISDSSEVATVISKYASIWQQGDLPHVDERRRQYLALYGFPLLSAARWGGLETTDPRRIFPPAFHRFLSEAMHYYRDLRNLQILPDVQTALAAFDALLAALREGNENMRRVRPPELRAQLEYSKQVLGGFRNGQPATLVPLEQEWAARLPGRPGVQGALDPWQFAVDTVASLYRWQRPGITEYTTLAECGEVILVLSRIVAPTGVVTISPALFQAFLEVMQDIIQRYVNAYKAVSQVDLAARGAFLGPPSEAMARSIQPPVIPPLKRNWAAEVPLTA